VTHRYRPRFEARVQQRAGESREQPPRDRQQPERATKEQAARTEQWVLDALLELHHPASGEH